MSPAATGPSSWAMAWRKSLSLSEAVERAASMTVLSWRRVAARIAWVTISTSRARSLISACRQSWWPMSWMVQHFDGSCCRQSRQPCRTSFIVALRSALLTLKSRNARPSVRTWRVKRATLPSPEASPFSCVSLITVLPGPGRRKLFLSAATFSEASWDLAPTRRQMIGSLLPATL